MKNFQFTASVPAPAKEQAVEKMQALMTLASYLNAKELKAFAHVVTNDPSKIAAAKSFLGI